jgi:hypothetical protein
MKLRLAALWVLLFAFAGCQFNPYADDLTTNHPSFKDIIGTYIFEKQTLVSILKDKKAGAAKIVIYSDSTYRAINVADFEGKIGFQDNGIINKTGKWNIETVGGIANGSGGVDNVWGIALTSMPENLQHIGFMGEKPPYKLIVTYGDPDTGAVMIFRKI